MEARKRTYWRSYRVANELRMVEAHSDLVRAKRGRKRLPNPWDDKPKGRSSHRSWKARCKKRAQWA